MHSGGGHDNAVGRIAKRISQVRALFGNYDGERQDMKDWIVLQLGEEFVQIYVGPKRAPAVDGGHLPKRNGADCVCFAAPSIGSQNTSLIARELLGIDEEPNQNVSIH